MHSTLLSPRKRLALRMTGVLLAWLSIAAPAEAGEFEFTIEVKSKTGQVRTERTDRNPGATEPADRPVLRVERDAPLALHWKGANTSKSSTFPEVLVHFFVVKEQAAGQKKPPPLDETVLYEGALTMDFKPGASTQGEFTLRLPEAGAYLVRVETIGLLDQHGHEHFTALDLVAE